MENYLSGHRGFGRILRLNFIIDRCPSLRVEALRMLMSHLKKETYDVQAYLNACQRLAHALNSTDDNNPATHDMPSSTSSPFAINGLPEVSVALGEPLTNGTQSFGGEQCVLSFEMRIDFTFFNKTSRYCTSHFIDSEI